MKRPRSAHAPAICTAIAIAIPLTAAPAEAAPTYTRPYSVVRESYSASLKRCLRISLWGSIKFSVARTTRTLYVYKNVEIRQPTMRGSVLATCGKTKTSTVRKMSLTQRWRSYESGCSVHLDVSDATWDIGTSMTPTCKTRQKIAVAKTSYDATSHYYTQYQSGSPVIFTGRTAGGTSSQPLCLLAKPTVTAYRGAASRDTWTTSFKVCVKP